ncbi:AI-2E family transporter [Salinispirillum sp. LH 10-3-1]|uniref:AI-2E family transporter n=1 Tax=Salinispirillum sp. LH 10-3-1 TaxID=2952525 RepID=A0AB38YBP6_9GAMM
MSHEKKMSIDFAPAQKQLLRYTILALSAVTLLGTVVFVLWVLGKVIGFLHLLVFPLAIGGLLALILFPVIELFEHRLRMNRLAAVISLFVVLFALCVTVLVLVLPAAVYQGSQFIESIPAMAERGYSSLTTRFPRALPMLENALAEMDVQSMLPGAEATVDRVFVYIGFLVGLGFVPLYLFFALLSGHHLKASARGMLFVLSPKSQNDVLYHGQLFVDYLTAFFRGQLTIALIMGVMMAIGFTVVGLEAAIYFGLALGLLNIVPYLGFMVGTFTVLPVAYFQPDGSTQLVLLVMVVIAVTQLVESMFLTPKIMADRSGLHPALVVISILFWGTVFGGVVGMILAVPLTAFLVTVVEHTKSRFNRQHNRQDVPEIQTSKLPPN